MEKEKSLFERIMFEAPGDDPPPDLQNAGTSTDAAPDLPPDLDSGTTPANSGGDSGPPDLGGDESGDQPPDIEGGDFGDEEGGFDDPSLEDGSDPNQDLELDEKISAIMNMNLYQRYLALINTIGSQIAMIKNNSDMLYTLSSESLDIVGALKKLDENIRLYTTNYFLNENYSRNLLFFNKCLNLLKLLNDIFDKNVQKGIKAME